MARRENSVVYGHYVARMRPYQPHISSDEMYRWLWAHLQDGFPLAIACVLMPNHLHLIAQLFAQGRRRLAAILGAFARTFSRGEVWQAVPDPEPLHTADKVPRLVRYGALNPCRPWSGFGPLVSDPLAWPWSTHRDAIGATAEPWISSSRLAEALGWDDADFTERFHRYVSSDPHVTASGTPLPQIVPASDLPAQPLESILHAAAAATRASTDAIRQRGPTRTLFIALARRQGWPVAAAVAQACEMSDAWVRQAARSCPSSWLKAGALCLGDARLTCATASLQKPLFRAPTSTCSNLSLRVPQVHGRTTVDAGRAWR